MLEQYYISKVDEEEPVTIIDINDESNVFSFIFGILFATLIMATCFLVAYLIHKSRGKAKPIIIRELAGSQIERLPE